MRRHAVLIALILSIAFLVYKFESITSAAHDRPAVIDEGVTLEPTPRPRLTPGDRVSAARSALSPTPADSTGDADEKCWKQINDQLRTNRYVESIRPKLESVVGPWFYGEEKEALKRNETSTPGRFFQALAEAGLLEGRTLEENPEHAMKLFKEVADADRTNSAPLLFAGVLAERGGDKDAADLFFEEARKRSNFNSYVLDFSRGVLEDVKTVDDWFDAISVTSRIPIPQMSALGKFLKGRDSSEIAVSMVNNYPFQKESPISDVDWFPIEYATAINVLKANDPQLTTLFPEFKTLLRKSMEANNIGPLEDFWVKPSKYGCDIRVLEPALASYQERLRAGR